MTLIMVNDTPFPPPLEIFQQFVPATYKYGY